MADRW